MAAHAPIPMDARVVLVSERDQLALEWELHHVRWLLGECRAIAEGAAVSERLPPAPAPNRPRWPDEMSWQEINAHRDAAWAHAVADLQAACAAHDAERAWWAAHKETAPRAVLAAAVRAMMTKAGGARAPGFSDLSPADEDPDPARDIRPLRWLLRVRAEIARRRMLIGELHLVLVEGQERGIAWAEVQLDRWGTNGLSRRIADIAFEDTALAACADTAAVAALVRRREAAAAAHGVTGDHRAPAMLDLDRIGAHDTAS